MWFGSTPERDNKPEWTLSLPTTTGSGLMIEGNSADEILTRLRAHLAAQNIPASTTADVGKVDPPTPDAVERAVKIMMDREGDSYER
jgi:hypothetical protein